MKLVKAKLDLVIKARPTLDSRGLLTRITRRETRRVIGIREEVGERGSEARRVIGMRLW